MNFFPQRNETRHDLFFFMLLGAAFCLVGIGRGSLASWDEAYYAVVSKAILQRGDWVHLWSFDNPFFDKPPLYLWVTAFFYKLLGVNELATRLGSGLSGVGLVVVTYLLGRRLFGRAEAVAGAGVLLSSTDFLHYARFGTLDIMHLFFFTLAIYFFVLAKDSPYYYYGFWLASAAAVMTKGPLIILAWLVLLLYCLIEKRPGIFKKTPFWLGLLLALLLVLPWHVAAYLSNPPSFMNGFVYKHYLARTMTAVEGHTGNFYYYIRTLINKYHPWVIAAPLALFWAWREASKSKDSAAYRTLLFWIGLVFIFFTFFVKTKLRWYILPLHPALSLLIGAWLVRWVFSKLSLVWLQGTIVLVLVLHLPFSSAFHHDYASGIKALASDVKSAVPGKERVYLYDQHEQPAALFYFERPTSYIDTLSELDEHLESAKPLYLVIRQGRYAELSEELGRRGLEKISATRDLEENLVFLSRGGN